MNSIDDAAAVLSYVFFWSLVSSYIFLVSQSDLMYLAILN